MARNFNANTDWIQVTRKTNIEGFTAFTAMGWYRRKGNAGSSGGALFGKCYATTEYDWAIRDDNSNVRVWLRTTESGLRNSLIAATPATNEWHHWAFNWKSATDGMRKFRDGVFQSSDTWTGTLTNNTADFGIGRQIGSTVREITGDMAEVAVWNRYLTDGEIASAMWRVMNVPDGLVLYFPLWGDNDPEYSLEGLDYGCTLNGTVDAVSHAPVSPFMFGPSRSAYVVSAASPIPVFMHSYRQRRAV